MLLPASSGEPACSACDGVGRAGPGAPRGMEGLACWVCAGLGWQAEPERLSECVVETIGEDSVFD
ncbi:MAG: hypothetical protein AB7S26_32715 [Sandaracinaceae bacterium]